MSKLKIYWSCSNANLQATDVPIEDIMAFDNKCFLIKNSPLRKPFLEHWIRVPGGSAFVAVDGNGKVIGIGCRRPAFQHNKHLIGPLYAIKESIAQALIARLSEDVIGHALVLNIRYTIPSYNGQLIFLHEHLLYLQSYNRYLFVRFTFICIFHSARDIYLKW